jgi:hypothetical protein
MDIAVDVVFGDGFDDTLGAPDVDVGQGEVLGGVVAADEVVDDVGVTDASFDGVFIAEVVLLFILREVGEERRCETYNEDDSSQVSRHLEVSLCCFFAEGNDYGAAKSCWGMSVM